ncbi:hypothetical protein N7462_009989 [Penicillium macrosclerotiorum]|uniref:uncharacterized protein n=1 Tax=Penicillium macrosclerotiorum TaxID=303699 RepID=UPI0025471239|nr:uncharacterized protein N7462_009989 [Penicillium macrosclerotiorum]KAJ5668919.1 hypothetical protein N7462_009989 [Penicillium macrosclerotiorum]
MTEMYSGLHTSQRFSSLEDFKTVIRSISVRQHWELRVIRSNKKSVVIGCRSAQNCYFRVVCRSNKNATYITSLQDSHSCRRSAESPAITPARSEASHVRFLLSEIPKLFDMKTRIKGQDVVEAVKRYHGYDISMRQAQRALTKLQPRQADGPDEQILDMDTSPGDQQSPTQSQAETQGEAAPAFREMSEPRWIADHLPPTLIDDDPVHPTESPYDPRSMTVSQPGVGYPTASPLSVAGPEHPKPSNYGPRNDHHAAPQMVLTNFKIEFTCTTCGALNQSFFPNQGNVTGAGFMAHHPVPSQGAVARHPGPAPPNGPVGNGDVSEDSPYVVNSLNARAMQNAWAAGNLGVPIGPSNT